METTPCKTPRNGRKRLPGVLLFNVLLPLAIFAVASQYTTTVVSMVLYSIPPFGKCLYELCCVCHVDWISIAQLIITAVSIVFMIYTDDPRIGLAKDVVIPLCFNVLIVSSLCNEHFNVIWLTYRFWNEATSPEADLHFDKQWSNSIIRRRFQRLAGFVGAFLFIEDGLRLYFIFHSPFSTMVYVSPLVGLAATICTGAYIVYSIQSIEELSMDESTPLL